MWKKIKNDYEVTNKVKLAIDTLPQMLYFYGTRGDKTDDSDNSISNRSCTPTSPISAQTT